MRIEKTIELMMCQKNARQNISTMLENATMKDFKKLSIEQNIINKKMKGVILKKKRKRFYEILI